jgi:hypothetical protein
MQSLSETPGLNSIVKVPFTYVCRTLYGPLVLLPNLQCFSSFSEVSFVEGYSRIDNAFDFLLCDLVFVPISNQRNIKENVSVECETSGATCQGRMYCCSHGLHSNG